MKRAAVEGRKTARGGMELLGTGGANGGGKMVVARARAEVGSTNALLSVWCRVLQLSGPAPEIPDLECS